MIAVIPEPKTITIGTGKVFSLSRLCEITADESSKKAEGDFLSFSEKSLEIAYVGTGKESITLALDPELKTAESYTLDITENRIEIKGADEAGIFYGVQTLKQIFITGGRNLPEIHIEDEPAYGYRGFMLDCGRYFYKKEDIKFFLDLMAIHKLNRFHWHLTEDQGWRAQIDSKLLLTEIGSYRAHTNFNKIPHGGYYTKEDMKEIVAYAHERCIKVIPEVDSPGHMVAAISAYPELSCFERDLQVECYWGIKYDVVCVGKESTFDFMFSVFDELAEIFTDGVIHVGADEVPTERWKLCPHCQKRMRDEGLTNVEQLHAYYLTRLAAHLKEKGLQVVMWNDKKSDYMADGEIIRQLWNGDMPEKDRKALLEEGMKFIDSNSEAYYLDLPLGMTNLKKTYEYKPLKHENVIGVEGCLWTEFIPSMERAMAYSFPRLGAIAENAWTKEEKLNFENFLKKDEAYMDILSAFGIEGRRMKNSIPGKFTNILHRIYWERRQLCWNGLHNVIDNKKVEKLAKEKMKND